MTKIGIVTRSTRNSRVNMQVAEWLKDLAEILNTGAEFEIVDLNDYEVPLFNEDVPPAMANKQYSTDVINNWSAKIDSLDGYIFVTPEYNKAISPSLKNQLDYIGPEFANKAAGIVGYGSTLALQQHFHFAKSFLTSMWQQLDHSVHSACSLTLKKCLNLHQLKFTMARSKL